MNRFALCIVICLFLACPQTVSAMPDVVQEELLRQCRLPLRWDNIEGAPAWVDGVFPQYCQDIRMHRVVLEGTDETLLRIPAGEQLRIHDPESPLAAMDLDVMLADGSGLFAAWPLQRSEDGHSLLLSPEAAAPMLARVRLPAGGKTRSLALFLSRRQPLGEIAPYRRVLELPGPASPLRTRRQATSEEFYRLEPGQPLRLEVTGPLRLAVENRLAYPPREAEQRLGYQLWARLADGAEQVLEFSAAAANSEPLFVAGREELLGRLETGYLEIPAGRHTLELDGTAPLYVRLLAQDDPDYLLPGLNAPAPTAAEIRQRTTSDLAVRPWTAVDEDDLARLQAAPPVDNAERERLALRMARDNRRADGGMTAAALLREAAEKRPNEPRLATLAGRLEGSHTFYRDLLPARKPESAPQRFGWVLTAPLRDPAAPPSEVLLAEQHLEIGLDQIVGGHFVPVSRRRPEAGEAARPLPENRLSLPLPGDLLFDTDRHELRPDVREALNSLADWLRDHSRGEIRVVGHTDSRATDDYNQRLSEQRAAAVTLFLARRGLAPERLAAIGKGESEPRADNDSAEGMQRNRRVEIEFQSKDPAPPAPVEEGQLYRLPDQGAPGSLRLLAFTEEPVRADFQVQYDAQPPIRLQLAPETIQPESDFERTTARRALALLQRRHPQTNAGTLGGPFAMRRAPAPRRDAARLELPLPAGVRELRVWREDEGPGQLYLALQYRASRPYRLAETTFLEMLRRAPESDLAARLTRLLRDAPRAAEAEAAAAAGAELDNHLWPLARWLIARERAFAATVAEPPAPVAATLDAATLGALQSLARRAASEGDGLTALETWGRVARGLPESDAPARREARLGQADALRDLGETFLAERQLRVMLLNDADPELREQAFIRLEETARRSGDVLALQTLLATRAVREPSSRWFRELAASLIESGDYDLALAAGLAGFGQEPSETLMRAAFQLSWWETFEDLAGRLPADRRDYWLGLRQLEAGDEEAARRLLAQGGDPGNALLSRLDAGLDIHRRLRSADLAERETALLDWERWQAEEPGPFAWREEPGQVLDYAGVEQLYSIDTDRHGRAYRSAPDRPLRLRLIGPARLRLEARPLFADGAREPFDGWLRVRKGESLRLLAISGNQPTPGLRVVGAETAAVGVLESREFDFGPGLHDIELACDEGPLLIRPLVRRPELPLPVLPPLTADTIPGAGDEADLRALFARLAERRPVAEPERYRALAAGDLEKALAEPAGEGAEEAEERLALLLWLTEQQPDRRLWALGEAEALAARYPRHAALRPLLARLGRGSEWQSVTLVAASAGLRLLPVTGWQPESPSLRARLALMAPLAEGEQLVFGGSALVLGMFNVQERCLRLELKAEEAALQPPEPLTALVALDAEAPRRIELSAADPGATLELCVPPGQHSLRVGVEQSWANQYLRARLLEADAAGFTPVLQQYERVWQVATAQEPLRLLVAGPAWLRIDEQRRDEVATSYQSVAEGWQEVALAPEAGQGERLLRVSQRQVNGDSTPSVARPLADTSVPVPPPLFRFAPEKVAETVKLTDAYPLGGQEDGTWSGYTSLTRRRGLDDEVDYQEKFVEIGGQYRYHDDPRRNWFKTTLLGRFREEGNPTLGAKQEFWHQFRKVPLTLEIEGSTWIQEPGGKTELEKYGPREGLSSADIDYLDQFADQDQEVEWSTNLSVALSQKRVISPKTWHVPRMKLFARYLSLKQNAQFDSEIVKYLKNRGKEIFNPIKNKIDKKTIENTPEDIINELVKEAGLNYRSSDIKAIRNLLGDNPIDDFYNLIYKYNDEFYLYDPEILDQDVFSQYKSDHRHGLTLSDTLYHRPWLDTLWFAGLRGTSNEDFAPDNVNYRLGWRQLLGPLQVDLEYRGTRYLNDADRVAAYTRESGTLNFLWGLWLEDQHRIEVLLTLQRDFHDSETLGMLSFFWHGGNGRGYRDFWPGEVDFLDLRERRASLVENNGIDDGQAD